LTKEVRDDLINRAGSLTESEQVLLAQETKVYIQMSLKLERALHKAIKQIEEIDA
jgi:hypothetical protein